VRKIWQGERESRTCSSLILLYRRSEGGKRESFNGGGRCGQGWGRSCGQGRADDFRLAERRHYPPLLAVLDGIRGDREAVGGKNVRPTKKGMGALWTKALGEKEKGNLP